MTRGAVQHCIGAARYGDVRCRSSPQYSAMFPKNASCVYISSDAMRRIRRETERTAWPTAGCHERCYTTRIRHRKVWRHSTSSVFRDPSISTAAVLNRIIQVVSAGLASTSLINLQLPCVKHRLEKRASFYSQRRRLYRQLYGHNIFMSVAARVTF